MILEIKYDSCTVKVSVCDSCGAQPDSCLVKGLFHLSCGHTICDTCMDYARANKLKVHGCPEWSLGLFPS